jgi:hypothetical protein
METSRSCFLSVPVFIAGSMLSACDRGPGLPTNISYRQIGICKGFEAASGPVTSKADEAHAVFKIETVDNTKSNKAFTFDPKLIYVDQSNPDQRGWDVRPLYRRFASMDSRIPQSLGVSLAPESMVPPGGKLDVNSFVVILLGLNNPSGAPEANKLAFELLLDSANTGNAEEAEIHAAKGIVFNKTNAADTKWTVTENCKELSFK